MHRNRWGELLALAPTTLQRLIARVQRVSLPRHASPDLRLQRLRAALCTSTAVHTTWATLDLPTQTAIHTLATTKGGIAPADLFEHYGALRSLEALRTDPTPITITERLVLLGWLLPRPPLPFHPLRYVVPQELRSWLPQPLPPQPPLPPPEPATTPALYATGLVLLATAQPGLSLTQHLRLRVTAAQPLATLLDPDHPQLALALLNWLVPLLIAGNFVAVQARRAIRTDEGERFLLLPHDQRLETLRTLWIKHPYPESWLIEQTLDLDGVDLPVLRRRLMTWGQAAYHLGEPKTQQTYQRLCAAFGPLANQQTHGFRTVKRTPWKPPRARAILATAMEGPLTWLGFFGSPPLPPPPPPTWDATTQTVHLFLPLVGDHTLLCLWPYGTLHRFHAGYAQFTISAATLSHAVNRGYDPNMLRQLLNTLAGNLASEWSTLFQSRPIVDIFTGSVVISTDPTILRTVRRSSRTLQRYTKSVAPGILLVDPAYHATVQRVLEQFGITLRSEQVGHQSAAEQLPSMVANEPTALPSKPKSRITYLQHAINAKRVLTISYVDRRGKPSQRMIRPLELEQRHGTWYLIAYCHTRHEERSFAVERLNWSADQSDSTAAWLSPDQSPQSASVADSPDPVGKSEHYPSEDQSDQ
jgi:hypothetical protein